MTVCGRDYIVNLYIAVACYVEQCITWTQRSEQNQTTADIRNHEQISKVPQFNSPLNKQVLDVVWGEQTSLIYKNTLLVYNMIIMGLLVTFAQSNQIQIKLEGKCTLWSCKSTQTRREKLLPYYVVSVDKYLDCLLGLYWTGLTLLNGFSFLVNFLFFFYFGSCGRLSWGLTASFRAHVNIVSLLTYLLTYLLTSEWYEGSTSWVRR